MHVVVISRINLRAGALVSLGDSRAVRLTEDAEAASARLAVLLPTPVPSVPRQVAAIGISAHAVRASAESDSPQLLRLSPVLKPAVGYAAGSAKHGLLMSYLAACYGTGSIQPLFCHLALPGSCVPAHTGAIELSCLLPQHAGSSSWSVESPFARLQIACPRVESLITLPTLVSVAAMRLVAVAACPLAQQAGSAEASASVLLLRASAVAGMAQSALAGQVAVAPLRLVAAVAVPSSYVSTAPEAHPAPIGLLVRALVPSPALASQATASVSFILMDCRLLLPQAASSGQEEALAGRTLLYCRLPAPQAVSSGEREALAGRTSLYCRLTLPQVVWSSVAQGFASRIICSIAARAPVAEHLSGRSISVPVLRVVVSPHLPAVIAYSNTDVSVGAFALRLSAQFAATRGLGFSRGDEYSFPIYVIEA